MTKDIDSIDEQAADIEAIEETKHAQQRSANVAKQWWKEGLKFGKLPTMPPKNYKKSLINLPWLPEKPKGSKKKSSKSE